MATLTTLLDESTLARSQAGDAAGLHLLVMGPKLFATFALPVRGEVIVGRGGGEGADVRVDDPKASRRHLRLHVGDEIEVEASRQRERHADPRSQAAAGSAGSRSAR